MKCICSFCEFFDSSDNILLCFTKYSLFKDISYRSSCPFWTSLKPRLIKYFVRNTKYLLLISLIFVYAIQNLIIFITYYSSRFEKHLRSRYLPGFGWIFEIRCPESLSVNGLFSFPFLLLYLWLLFDILDTDLAFGIFQLRYSIFFEAKQVFFLV